MPISKLLRLGLINVAVALTAVPINGTLNRVMISELGLPATLVAILIALPYLFSPVQIWIGGYSDTHPLLGLRRTPYIVLGLVLCVAGSALAPTAALALGRGGWSGLSLGVLAFGAWGMGFNFATVSYLSLATELAGPEHRTRTVGVMWFMLIVAVIIAGISISRMLPPEHYDEAALFRAIYITCLTALLIGLFALIRLEPRATGGVPPANRRTWRAMLNAIHSTPQARLFFVYLILLLIAILGQDVLLEPYAADVFGVPIAETTRYTSIWGAALLTGLLITSSMTRRFGKLRVTAIGAILVAAGLLLIAGSGLIHQRAMLIPSLLLFGFGSGISTAANLSLMLDMTVPGQVGVFVGAWGMADALARLLGTVLSGVVRDSVTALLSGEKLLGYVVVFLLQSLAMLLSLAMLPRLSVARFQEQAANPSPTEVMGLAGETGGG
jgi:BCD family chlorophyll transporter-like MFS transporter